MSKIDDGNTTDVRLRPDTPPIPGADEDLRAPIPVGEPCTTQGTQTDFPPSGPVGPIPPPNGPLVPPVPPSDSFLSTYNWGNLNGICPDGLDITSVNDIIFQLLAIHFSSPDNIVNPNLKSFIYTKTLPTALVINVNTTYNPATATNLPALIIVRNQIDVQRIVIGDQTDAVTDPNLGIFPYVRRVRGSYTILCITSFPGVTEELAQEVFDFLTCLSPVLRTELPFADFQVNAISNVQLADPLANRTVVGVQILYEYEYGWKIQYQTAPLSKITATETTVIG